MTESNDSIPKRKTKSRNQNQNQNPLPLGEENQNPSQALLGNVASLGTEVEVEVSQPEIKTNPVTDLLTRATARIGQVEEEEEEIPVKKSHRRPQNNRVEVENLITSVLALGLAASNLPREIQPNTDEIGGISYHLTRILARHLPLNTGLTADALDIIGLITISSSWYARVSPELRRRAEEKHAAKIGIPVPASVQSTSISPDNDIAISDAAVDQFLNDALRHAPGGENVD